MLFIGILYLWNAQGLEMLEPQKTDLELAEYIQSAAIAFVEEYKMIAGFYADGAIWECSSWNNVKWSLVHEYIHYLTVGEGRLFRGKTGMLEGITESIAIFECKNNTKNCMSHQRKNTCLLAVVSFAYLSLTFKKFRANLKKA